MSPCPKWRSLSTSGFCSRVRGWWGVRSTGESEEQEWCCMRFTAWLWQKGSWAERQSSWSTGQSSSLPSPMVMRDGWCHQDAFRGKCSWHVQLGGDLGVDHHHHLINKDQVEGLHFLSGLGAPRIPHSELANVAGEREVWGSLLKLLPLRPDSR